MTRRLLGNERGKQLMRSTTVKLCLPYMPGATAQLGFPGAVSPFALSCYFVSLLGPNDLQGMRNIRLDSLPLDRPTASRGINNF